MLRIFYNLCTILFVISSTVIIPGNGDDGLRECGILKIYKPSILGRNVTISFTPDTYDPNAILEWQRSSNGIDQWQTLPFNNKFTQYEKNATYHLIITDSEVSDNKFYRAHYYNETIHCWMDAGYPNLEAIFNLCGVVHLRSEKVVENGTVEIEYYPSNNVMRNSGSFKREWKHIVGRTSKTLKLTDGNYQETLEQNNKYVLTIYMFNISMNGKYRVYCGGSENLYTDEITVYLPGDYSLSKCGRLSIDKPTILGRNVTFSFTPTTYDPHAILRWGKSMNGINHWLAPLRSTKKKRLYEENMIYYLIIMDSDKDNEVFYRVKYYNERLDCDVYAGKLTLEEPPSVPIIVGLQDIENCTDCIVGEDLEMFGLACQIHAGTRPINVTMTIGNESHTPHKMNSTTYRVFFTVRDRHHMEHVTFSVMNDLLSSPLNVTARMFVIKPPTFQFSVPEILKDGEGINITCTMDDGRPNPHVYFSISGSEVLSANSHFYNSTTSLNSNIITLTTFKKKWNNENITCCRYNEWYKIARDCSPPKQVNYHSKPDDKETGDDMSTPGKNETGVGSGAVVGFAIAALAVGILIGGICTFFILTRKGIIAGSKTQSTDSHEIELTEPPTDVGTYEQLRNRTNTEINGTYDSLEVNSGVQPNSQSQYESLNRDAEKYHTYTDLKQSR